MDEFLMEKGLLPDFLIRMGIRSRLAKKINDEKNLGVEKRRQNLLSLLQEIKQSSIAVHTKAANEQHYELPAEFFERVLGKHLKYSSGFWKRGVRGLDQSEKDMLDLTILRADIRDGQKVLELGCGWGSFSLYAAGLFPKAEFLGVSNSNSQRAFIEKKAKDLGLKNLKIITQDMNDFKPKENYFDRVVSIEMFEHMRNYKLLFEKIARSMKDDAKLFVHIFCHKEFVYLFDQHDAKDWIAKYFFTGGMMPSKDLYAHFNENLKIAEQWTVDGTNYAKTSRAWLVKMDTQKKAITQLFKKTYGQDHMKWLRYWRVFFMACEELFAYNRGREWFVCHYCFKKNDNYFHNGR